jgi:hypothetical protein
MQPQILGLNEKCSMNIMQFCDYYALKCCLCVSNEWNKAASQDSLWINLIQGSVNLPEGTSPKNHALTNCVSTRELDIDRRLRNFFYKIIFSSSFSCIKTLTLHDGCYSAKIIATHCFDGHFTAISKSNEYKLKYDQSVLSFISSEPIDGIELTLLDSSASSVRILSSLNNFQLAEGHRLQLNIQVERNAGARETTTNNIQRVWDSLFIKTAGLYEFPFDSILKYCDGDQVKLFSCVSKKFNEASRKDLVGLSNRKELMITNPSRYTTFSKIEMVIDQHLSECSSGLYMTLGFRDFPKKLLSITTERLVLKGSAKHLEMEARGATMYGVDRRSRLWGEINYIKYVEDPKAIHMELIDRLNSATTFEKVFVSKEIRAKDRSILKIVVSGEFPILGENSFEERCHLLFNKTNFQPSESKWKLMACCLLVTSAAILVNRSW